MNRVLLRVWASVGDVTDPDLDAGHPSGTGGAGKYDKGWVVEKEPHQWANFIYNAQTTAQVNFAEHGVQERSSITYSIGALSWYEDKITVLTAGGWHESFGSLTLDEAEGLKSAGRSLYDGHVPRTDRPHEETAEQLGTVPTTGGRFTGKVFYRGGFLVGLAQFKNLSASNDVWLFSNTIQKGFSVTANGANFYTGTTNSKLLLVGKLPEYEAAANPRYAIPEPDAYWPLKTNPYSEFGEGYLEVLGGDQTPVFQKFGLQLESTKSYMLSDLVLLDFQGCATAMVNGVGVFKNAPAGTAKDLKDLFGSNVNVCDVRIWGYQLTAEQVSNVLATFV